MLLVAFVRFELRAKNPLIDIRVMSANREFAVDNILTFLVFAPWLAVFFFGSMYFQIAVGQEPTQAGFSILTMFYTYFIGARIGGGWMDKVGPKKPVAIGFLLGTIGMIVWAQELSELGHAETTAGMLLTGAGFGLVLSPLNTDALNRVPEAIRGQASGITQTFRNFGSAIGMAIMGTVVASATDLRGAPGCAGLRRRDGDGLLRRRRVPRGRLGAHPALYAGRQAGRDRIGAHERSSAFGLAITGEVPIAGTAGGSEHTVAEIDITLVDVEAIDGDFAGGRRIAESAAPDGGPGLALDDDQDGGYRLFARGNGTFGVTRDLIRCAPAPGVPDWRWQRFFTGQVLPLAALLNGLEPFHASAVDFDGGAVLLVAGSGTGKTSLGLRLVAGGAAFLADDVAALEARGDELMVHPGPAVANVARDTHAAVGGALGEVLGETMDGLRVAIPRAGRPVPLRRIYFLRRGPSVTELAIEPAPEPRLLLGSTFNTFVDTPARLRAHLQVSAVADRCAARFRVDVPVGLDAERTADRLLRHAAGAIMD